MLASDEKEGLDDVILKGPVEEYVYSQGGDHVIKRILIASNGIGAVKGIRSIRKWAYEVLCSERAIQFIVMATPDDIKANAEFVHMADQYVEVPGGTNNNNYANVSLIAELAERMLVDAVWAGWGHASENPMLPDALAAITSRRVSFIGPSSAAMYALGDKIAASIVAQSAKVPTLPWSGDGLVLPPSFEFNKMSNLRVPADICNQACVNSLDAGLSMAHSIGFPVMIKASEGGGGKGIRKVSCPDDFAAAYRHVSHEVSGSPIFIMKLASQCRHLEVQIVADNHGQVIALFGRDCSIQRRHQKIIEEAPVTVAPAHVFREMEQCAIRLAQMVGYVNAGTVEFLFDPLTENYYFLEMNPRLQVEHPTTEMVSKVNLPSIQLQIAMGIPLARIASTRPFCSNQLSASSLPISMPTPCCHVIAARITSENPESGFQPMNGQILELNFRSSTHAWGYFSIMPKGGLHDFADSQFGHIFAYGETRQEARIHLIMALKELSIRGDFHTTVEYLITLLECRDFVANRFHTEWLDKRIASQVKSEKPDEFLTLLCAAMYYADKQFDLCMKNYTVALEKGQVLGREILLTRIQVEWVLKGVRYPFSVARTGPNHFSIHLHQNVAMLEVRRLSDGGYLVSLSGECYVVYFKEESTGLRLTLQGKTCTVYHEIDATRLIAPSAGRLLRWVVADGCHVNAGQVYAESEIMKMVVSLVSSESGTVKHVKPTGSVLVAGDLIGDIILDDPDKAHKSVLFTGQLPAYDSPHKASVKPHHQMRQICQQLYHVLEGYASPSHSWSSTLNSLKFALRNIDVFRCELQEALATVSGKIPLLLEEQLKAHINEGLVDISELDAGVDGMHGRSMRVPGSRSRKLVTEAEAVSYLKFKQTMDDIIAGSLPSCEEMMRVDQLLGPLKAVWGRYEKGLKQHEMDLVCHILRKFIDIESIFDHDPTHGRRFQLVLEELRRSSKDMSTVVNTLFSHANLAEKNILVLAVMNEIVRKEKPLPTCYMELLKQLTQLNARPYSPIVLCAREILIESVLPSLEERLLETEEILRLAIVDMPSEESLFDLKRLNRLVETNDAVYDVLPTFFYHKNTLIRLAALEVYIRRSYQAYAVRRVVYHRASCSLEWHFDKSETVNEMNRVPSISEPLISPLNCGEQFTVFQGPPIGFRVGLMMTFEHLHDVHMGKILDRFKGILRGHAKEPVDAFDYDTKHIMMVCIAHHPTPESDAASQLTAMIATHRQSLRCSGLRRLTFVVLKSRGQFPSYFTFSQWLSYEEQVDIRHIEPALAYQLELPRLSNFDIHACPNDNPALHIYHAKGQQTSSDSRFFVRALVRPGCLDLEKWTADYLVNESDGLMDEILDALEILQNTHPNTDCNHFFFNVIPPLDVTLLQIQDAFRGFIIRHGTRLWKLRVCMGEVRICLVVSPETSRVFARLGAQTTHLTDGGYILPIRFTMNNVSGFSLKIHAYQESLDASGQWILRSVFSAEKGPQDGERIYTPYQNKEWLQPKRYSAQLNGTTYVYDFPELFRHSLMRIWHDARMKPTSDLLSVNELCLDDKDQLIDMGPGSPGKNTIGMVAWKMLLKTPEYPNGRTIVVVANDLTFQIGSFGPQEDMLFQRASELARKHGWPRIYLAANSGARIGLANEVKQAFRVAWRDRQHPALGFEYFYVTDEDQKALALTKSLITERIYVDGEIRHKIIAIVGKEHGLGVENLQKSAMIASETSRAYEEIFTITLVTCRTVGIGAYLVRLGQRCIQQEMHPILLTGAAALNKVLGKEVYTSNSQLGGTQIMYANGITHLTTKDDYHGVLSMLRWISFVPCHKDAFLPIWRTPLLQDPIDREVTFMPPGDGSYDPRWLITGTPMPVVPSCESNDAADSNDVSPALAWQSGLFDKDTFIETLAGWARTVVIGRARLGGVPIGIITAETRTIETVIDADPASRDSCQEVIQKAGQVWVPDSAYKTAQAIRDFNAGEQLPLFILANWRGFSGGQRDMYDSVLKFGAMIVDALREFRQPCFIYLPPFAELRGGSWVVIDASIHPEMMEMYADPTSRGGIIEPEGIVEIKYRKADLLATMRRLDDIYRTLCEKLDHTHLDEERVALKATLVARERELLPLYHQVASNFAALHDTPQRMHAKGVIRAIVPWRFSRKFFAWRLKRRVFEEYWIKKLKVHRSMAKAIVYTWLAEAGQLASGSGDGDIAMDVEDMTREDMGIAEYFASHEDVLNEKLQLELELHQLECAMKSLQGLSLSNKEKVLNYLQNHLKSV